MGKNKIIILVIAACLLLGGIFKVGMVVGAATYEPGSVGDPLITKSYLDKRLEEIGTSTGSTADLSYKKVTLGKGKTVIGASGTEIVIVSGMANAYSTSAGIVNLTVGEMAGNGITLGKYSTYLIIDDVSGITAASDCILFVKGSYKTR